MAIIVARIDTTTRHKHKDKHKDSHSRQMPEHKCKHPCNSPERLLQRTLLVMRHHASGEVQEVEEEDPVRMVDDGNRDEEASRDLHHDELELVDGCSRGG